MQSDASYLAKLEETIAAAKADIAKLEGGDLSDSQAWLLDHARATLRACEASLKAMGDA